MNIAFIPLDSRPVCYQLPIQTANLDKKNNILLPDISLMGSNKKIADIEGILDWLSRLTDIDVIIISLDTIAYGGLVSSRKSNDDYYEIKSRIERLKEILNKKNARIFAFSSIMRISNNNINDEEKEYWSEYGTKIFEYSYNMHKLEKMFKTSRLTTNCNESGIPEDILKDYSETRKRNFEINKYYIELKKQGLFDTLVFSKDDCAAFGFNVKEAEELKNLSSNIENIYIKTGADEIPLSLLSRAINKNKNIKIAPVYTNPDTIGKISKYEDISVKESVESQIKLAGGIVEEPENCDLILLVNNFRNEQGELVMNIYESGFSSKLSLPQKPYFIADILNANGADNNFVEALFEQDFSKNFYGYSAWNTTGNTLGSAISAALTYFSAKEKNKNMFQELQLTRFLDDWAYQANVRGKIRNNNENLSNNIIKNEMKPFEQILAEKFSYQISHSSADSSSPSECYSLQNSEPAYTFPWNRFFEIKITISKTEKKYQAY